MNGTRKTCQSLGHVFWNCEMKKKKNFQSVGIYKTKIERVENLYPFQENTAVFEIQSYKNICSR